MAQHTLQTLLRAMRLPFLVLTPACVLLGLGTALAAGHPVAAPDFLLVLAGAIFAHISVNALNEYHDFRSGLDLHTHRTPFSGGSGALPEHPEMVSAVLATGVVALALTVLIGGYFTAVHGWQILPVGIAGVVIIITYTRWINRYPWLCLVAPGLAFGPLMVVGTHLVLTGEYSPAAMLVSLVPFFLVSNLLLLNQYPDVEADRAAGRRHFPIAFGTRASTGVYGVFTLGGFLTILAGIAAGFLPLISLVALLPLLFALYSLVGVARQGAQIALLTPYLGTNVLASVLTPFLLSMTLIYG